MAPPSPISVFFAVGSVVFIVGGVTAFYRWSVTMYNIPRLVLILLAVTVGVWGVVGAAGVAWEAEKVDYTTTQYSDCSEASDQGVCPTSENPAIEFNELSSEAQNVFLSTVQGGGEHTTMTLPDDFNAQSTGTAPGRNYIRYDSDCYELIVDQGPGFAFLGVMLYIIAGFIGASVLTIASWFESFKMSLSIICSLCSVVGVVLFGITSTGPFLSNVWIGTLAGLPALTGTLAWVALRVIEKSSQRSFRERMER